VIYASFYAVEKGGLPGFSNNALPQPHPCCHAKAGGIK
jgi:hypothetical protein